MAFQETASLGEEGVAAGRLVPEKALRNAWTLVPQIPPNCLGHASKFAQRDACSRTTILINFTTTRITKHVINTSLTHWIIFEFCQIQLNSGRNLS